MEPNNAEETQCATVTENFKIKLKLLVVGSKQNSISNKRELA